MSLPAVNIKQERQDSGPNAHIHDEEYFAADTPFWHPVTAMLNQIFEANKPLGALLYWLT